MPVAVELMDGFRFVVGRRMLRVLVFNRCGFLDFLR